MSLNDQTSSAFLRAQTWSQDSSIDQESRQEILRLLTLSSNDPAATKEITERFYKELEFGTGGIRGLLGIGLNRINKYTIRRATEALAQTLKKAFIKGPFPLKVAISYDSRHFSFEFAKEAASVLAGHNIHAYLYKEMAPVALLSFAVRELKANAGIMVTASHNPAQYNGYKVYWSDGAQVTPPHDQKIIDAYYSQTNFKDILFKEFELAMKEGLIHWISDDIPEKYDSKIVQKTMRPSMLKENGHKLSIVYTPLHGSGYRPCTRILEKIGMTNVHLVPEQVRPNGDFPTVKKGPNPENPEALAMAVALMKEKNADIVFGTDPDADRLGVAIFHEGEIFYPNGNQIGVLMLDYIFSQLKEKNEWPSNPYIVKTIVTTRMLDVMAEHYGAKVENTLTGFKWICGRMNQIEEKHPDWNFLFATEESFGYMHHNYVRDKDAISSMALMAEVALFHKLNGRNLAQALDTVYEKYGLCLEALMSLDYFGKEGAEKIVRIMESFRQYNKTEFAGETITEVEDYEKKLGRNLKTKQERPLDLPKSNVLGLSFSSGHRLYLRPSGTEPKIKFYIMIVGDKEKKSASLKMAKVEAEKIIERFKAQIQNMANQA